MANENNSKPPSSETKLTFYSGTCSPLVGFVASLTVTLPVLILNVGLVWGLFRYPTTVGLFFYLPYYTYTLILSSPELKTGARWEWLSRYYPSIIWFRKFLSMKIEVHEKLQRRSQEEGAQFVFGLFPHGCNADFRVILDGLLYEVLPCVAAKTRTLAATVLFRIPLVRELSIGTGCVDARRSVADGLLRKGHSFIVLPGGQAEQIRTEYGREKLYVKKRKGFIKLALKHGVPVVPVYVFGASDYFYTSSWGRDFRLQMVKSTGMSIPLAWGIYSTPLCPLAIPTTVVFGEPIEMELATKGSPTDEELDKAHQLFCQGLVKLFDENKQRLGYGDRKLEIE